MLTWNVTYHCKSGQREAFYQALCDLGIRANSLKEEGNLKYDYFLAAEAPELVRRLVLVVTAGWANETVQETVGRWLLLAERGDYRRLMRDTAERSYSQRYLRRYRLLLPLLGTIGRPRSYQRFLIQARACLGHDARGALGRIGCPALVVGGGRDQVVGAEAAGVLAEHLSQSRLWIYPELGHGLYEEAADLPARVLAFLSQ